MAALAVAIGVYVVVAEISGYGELRKTLEEAHPAWLAAAVAGQAVAYGGYALGYRGAVRAEGGAVLPYLTALRVVVLGFGGHVIGASAGGIAVSLWALRRAGETLGGAARRAIAVATLEWLVLGSGAAAAGIVALLRRADEVPKGMSLGWIATVGAAVLLALVVTSRAPGRPGPVGDGRLARLRAALGRAWATALDATRLVRSIAAAPRRHGDALGGFAAYWAGDIVTLYAALRAFEVRLAVTSVILAYATGYVVASAPLPLGASGAAEASLAATLTAVGVSLAPAALAVLVYRVCTFWLPLLPALAALPSLRRLGGDLDAAAARRMEEPPAASRV